jgi:hypothetical protein
MGNTFIESRINRFERIFNKSDLISPLIAAIKIPDKDFDSIKQATELYLNSILGTDSLKDEDLISAYSLLGDGKGNVTPTGMILPKKDTSIEYNLFLRNYYRAISNLYFFNELSYCHTPAHLRVKWPAPKNSDLNRPRHAPEDLHLDSWSGYSSHGLTFLLGILGDTKRNRVNFYHPNQNFQESWLKQSNKPSINDLESTYQLIDYVPAEQFLVIMDTAVLHQTFREPNAEIRFSIDNIFLSNVAMDTENHIEEARERELTKPALLAELGSKCFYFCNHNYQQIKDSKAGSIDPTSYTFIEIKD